MSILKSPQTANVKITNNTDGDAWILLYHNNSTNGTEGAYWKAVGPGQTAGPMTVHFFTGLDVQTVEDYWSVLIQVQGGSTPGFYVNSGSITDPYWKECQLQHEDAGETLTFSVSTAQFHVSLTSGCDPEGMTKLSSSPLITNVFVLMLENHSFDNIFAGSGIPGIKAATTSNSNAYNNTDYFVKLSAPASMPTDPGHEFPDVVEQLCGAGATFTRGQPYPPIDNSGFAASYATSTTEGPAPSAQDVGDIMSCFETPLYLPFIADLAGQYAICDQWHSSLPGPTWPNRFFLHGASSSGLDTSPSTGQIAGWQIEGFQYPRGSIYEHLDAAGIPYRFYNDSNGDFLSLYSDDPQNGNLSGAAPQVTALHGVQLTDFNSLEHFAADLQGPYPYPYTFIEPHYGDVTGKSYVGGSSHHPMDDIGGCDSLVESVYMAIRTSPYWSTSLLVVVYDEHGGFYDSVAPTAAPPPGDNPPYGYNTYGFQFDRYGVRVPAIVVSPLIPAQVDSTLYDHSSVLATLEKLFGLAPLTERDATANTLMPLLSADTVRTDTVTAPARPKPSPMAATPAKAGEERALSDARPLPDKDNLLGVVYIMMKTEFELSGRTPAEIAAIKAKVAAIKTRGEAHAYITSVMEKVKIAKTARQAATPSRPPATMS